MNELDNVNNKINQTSESNKGALMLDKNGDLNAKGKFEPHNEKTKVFTFNLQIPRDAMEEEDKLNDSFKLDGDYWFGQITIEMPIILPVKVFNRLSLLTWDLLYKVQDLMDLIESELDKQGVKDIGELNTRDQISLIASINYNTLQVIENFNTLFFDMKESVADCISDHQLVIFFEIVETYPDLIKSVASFLDRQKIQKSQKA